MGDKSFKDTIASLKAAKSQPGTTIRMDEYKSEFKNKALAFADECLYKELKRQSDELSYNVNVTAEQIRAFLETAEHFISLHL